MRTCLSWGTLLSALWWLKWKGNPKKEGLYVHMWLIHFALWRKLTQHCEATVKVKVTQSSPTRCSPVNCTPHGILQARILEWVAFPFSRGSSQPKDRTQVSRIAGRFFTSWATREAHLASRDLVLNQWSHVCSICPLWLWSLSLSRQIWYFLQKIRLPL